MAAPATFLLSFLPFPVLFPHCFLGHFLKKTQTPVLGNPTYDRRLLHWITVRYHHQENRKNKFVVENELSFDLLTLKHFRTANQIENFPNQYEQAGASSELVIRM